MKKKKYNNSKFLLIIIKKINKIYIIILNKGKKELMVIFKIKNWVWIFLFFICLNIYIN